MKSLKSIYTVLFCVLMIVSSLSAKSNEDHLNNQKSLGYIKLCNYKIGYKSQIVIRNTIEFHLNNGIIFIKEFYPNKKLKSESYWVDEITPIYRMILYNQDGSIKRRIDKSLGKFDLPDILKRIHTSPVLLNEDVEISISNGADMISGKCWSLKWDQFEDKFSYSTERVFFDPKTGRSFEGGYAILSDPDQPYIEPTKDQLPTYPGGLEKLKVDLSDSLLLPIDSIVNSKVLVSFNVDPDGHRGNLHTEGSTDFINGEVLKQFKKMPDWQAAKDKSTPGSCKIDGEDLGKYMFKFSVNFRKFE